MLSYAFRDIYNDNNMLVFQIISHKTECLHTHSHTGKSNCWDFVKKKLQQWVDPATAVIMSEFMGLWDLWERWRAEEKIYFSSVTERWGWVSFLPKHPKSSPTVCCSEDLQLCSASPSPHAVTRAQRWSNKKSHFLKMSQQPSKQITAQ